MKYKDKKIFANEGTRYGSTGASGNRERLKYAKNNTERNNYPPIFSRDRCAKVKL